MEHFSIEICTDSAAFADSPASELARILREVAADIENCYWPETLRDANGDACGTVTVRKVQSKTYLYEHEDGRHIVARADAAAGDPAWHRVRPIEIHGRDA
jgi:predicted GNAT family acetyltransferase